MASALKNLSDFSATTIPDASSFRFGIVTAEWNAAVTGKLLSGAVEMLLKHGAKESNIVSIAVPGSFELVAGADYLAQTEKLDAIICLGCVIQGETRHFDFICDAVANGLMRLTAQHHKPFVFGVLTTNNQEQALDRAGGKHGNKGDEAAVTAIKMAALRKS